MEKNQKMNVLFLCTGNSCRSQMAEAIVNNLPGGEWTAYSAGTNPAGYVHPKALDVLEEMGITHDGQSKHVDLLRDIQLDLVITVCDSAAEQCPLWLEPGQVVHQGYVDPAEATGTHDEIMTVFRSVRDQIKAEIPEILDEFSKLSHLQNEERLS
jgi:arsenate reductase